MKKPPLNHRLSSVFAWILSVLGFIFLFLAGLVSFDDDPDRKDAVFGFLMFAAFFGFPGWVWLFRLRQSARREILWESMRGYVRSRTDFKLEEMARFFDRPAHECAQLVHRLIEQDPKVDLMYHPPSQTYTHRDILEKNRDTFREVDSCPDCGGKFDSLYLFSGEMAKCQYCGSVIRN